MGHHDKADNWGVIWDFFRRTVGPPTWQKRFEKEYLNYCRTGCKNCYKWNGYCRSQASGTPYKKFRRKYHDMSKYRTDV